MIFPATRLRLIRHAHVDTGTPPGRLCGALDLPLSERGERQIRSLLACPSVAPPPVVLYTSPLARARATAAGLARRWQLEPLVEEQLGEIACGALEGAWIAQIEQEQPELWARNRAQNDDDFTWPAGESYRQFRRRILHALGRIAERHAGHEVAVVTHSGVITQVIGTIERRPAAAWNHHLAAPLSVTEILWTNATPQTVLCFSRPLLPQ